MYFISTSGTEISLRNLVSNGNELSGFCSDATADATDCPSHASDPAYSPNSQWANLDAFLTKAEANGFYVVLHFANGQVTSAIQADTAGTTCSTIESNYATWIKEFVDYFEPLHANILAWGLDYNFFPGEFYSDGANPPTYATRPCNDSVWAGAYAALASEAAAKYPSYPLLGKVLVEIPMYLLDPATLTPAGDVVGRGSGYIWNWNSTYTGSSWPGTQQVAASMHSLLSKDPDYYAMGVSYNANVADNIAAIANAHTNTSYGGQTIDIEQESACHRIPTSSALDSSGAGVYAIGDAQTPVMSECWAKSMDSEHAVRDP